MLKLDKATKRRLAVQASCDPRTIEKILAGEPVVGMARERARAVLEREGFLVRADRTSRDASEGQP